MRKYASADVILFAFLILIGTRVHCFFSRHIRLQISQPRFRLFDVIEIVSRSSCSFSLNSCGGSWNDDGFLVRSVSVAPLPVCVFTVDFSQNAHYLLAEREKKKNDRFIFFKRNTRGTARRMRTFPDRCASARQNLLHQNRFILQDFPEIVTPFVDTSRDVPSPIAVPIANIDPEKKSETMLC